MSETLPKIWNTTFGDDLRNLRNIDFHIKRPKADYINKNDYVLEFKRGDIVAPDQAPDYIFFDLRDLTEDYKSRTPDLFMITGGVFVASQRFRDLLIAHDLGDTQLFEVPLYEYDQKTRRPGSWYILHISAKKPTVIPERSEGIRERGTKGYWGPDPMKDDILAVHASAAVGADLWIDPHFWLRIFLSDRLTTTIKAAGLKVRHMPFRPCVVIS